MAQKRGIPDRTYRPVQIILDLIDQAIERTKDDVVRRTLALAGEELCRRVEPGGRLDRKRDYLRDYHEAKRVALGRASVLCEDCGRVFASDDGVKIHKARGGCSGRSFTGLAVNKTTPDPKRPPEKKKPQ